MMKDGGYPRAFKRRPDRGGGMTSGVYRPHDTPEAVAARVAKSSISYTVEF